MTDQNTTPADEQTATLLVDRTSSTCGGCGKPTLPSALTHANVSGYDPKPGSGCGARFVAIRSANRSVTEEHLRSMRPDLSVDTGQEQQTADRPDADGELRATLSDLAGRWEQMAKIAPDLGDALLIDEPTPVQQLQIERAATYSRAATDLREVLATGRIPHGLMTDAELGG